MYYWYFVSKLYFLPDALLECAGLLQEPIEDILKCFKKIAILDTYEDDVNRKCNRCSCEQLRRMSEDMVLHSKISDMFCIPGNRKWWLDS